MSNNYSLEHEIYLKNINTRKKRILTTQIGILLFGLIIWELATQFRFIDPFIWSSPTRIWTLFLTYVSDGQLFHHVGVSVFETVAGFVIGTFLGLLIAIVIWWSDFIAKVLDPYLVVLNSLPKTALAPIFIIIFGAGYKGIIATAVSISIVVTIMNMFSSFVSVDEDKLRLLQTFGATKVQVLQKVILPQSIPDLISTLKVNIGLSWVGVIVGEFLVSKAGIGYLLVYGMQIFQFDLVMLNVVVLAIISALMYKIIAMLEKKIANWVD